jgi:ATP phosphoribosyltransferase
MFIGYQNNIARYIKNTREELEAIRNVVFDKIEEVEFAEMFNGVIYTSKEELLQAQTKAVEETRAGLYAARVDPITAHINRLRDEELTPEIAEEIAKLVEERKLLVEEIKAQHPYPAEPVVEESVVEPEPASEESVVELYTMEI